MTGGDVLRKSRAGRSAQVGGTGLLCVDQERRHADRGEVVPTASLRETVPPVILNSLQHGDSGRAVPAVCFAQAEACGSGRSERPCLLPFRAAFCVVLALFAAPTLLAAESAGVDVHGVFEAALRDFDRAQEMKDEDPARARQLFISAAQRFESIAATGIESGPLEYNLGNCYLQAGDVGRAILHYRRAERLIPNDPLVGDNLREARSRCLTSIPPSRERRFLRSVFFWHFDTTWSGRLMTALVFNGLFWLSLSGRYLVRRRWLSVATGVFGLVTVAVAVSLVVSDWTDRNAPPGVVLGMDVPVHHGPGASYQRRFEQPLQPGTEFTLIERRGSWWNIELPDGQTGWIEAAAVGLVPRNVS